MSEYRIIIADDHEIMRSGLKLHLSSKDGPRIIVAAEAENGRQLLELLEDTACDLVILDLSMPEMNGLETVAEIRKRFAGVRCVMLTSFPEYMDKARALGVAGYILKDESALRIAEHVRAILRGGTYYSRPPESEKGELAGYAVLPEILTFREKQVLKELARGKKNAEIAEELGLAVRTVEHHRTSLRGKLKLDTTADLIRYAGRHGLD